MLLEESKLKRELIQRILHSESFRSAPMLQHLLVYLAENADGGESGALKEYSIGVEALGRKADFDPKIDPIVRVQMHRLRQKLTEYYTAEGLNDPLVLEVPRGQYLLTFHKPKAGPTADALQVEPDTHSILLNIEPQVPLPHLPAEATPERGRSTRMPNLLIVAGAFVCGLLLAFLWMKTEAAAAPSENASTPVQAFWSQFLGNDKAPIIGYADAVFLLDDSNDLFRFRQGATDQRGALVTPDVTQQFAANPELAGKAGPLYYENGYTGTGELQSIAMLSSLFAKMGVKPTIKSSRDITTADLEQHSVVLLGSPFQNPAVAQLPTVGDFVFDNPEAHRELWRARILNLHARANEEPKYQTERDATTGVLKADYGLVSILQGIVPGVHIAILGGLDTTGTQGVTRFAVSPEAVTKMKDAMSSLQGGKISGFQALLKIDLEKGYEVLDTQMVTLHEMPKANAGRATSQSASAYTTP